tara:strand:+ start:284 stop:499 length:216 start_codon:yes stop_codon:yes gene_type:complete
MKKQIQTAKNHCANYNVGKCLGVMFSRDKNNNIKYCLDAEFAEKKCVLEFPDKKCSYFNNFVVPSVSALER